MQPVLDDLIALAERVGIEVRREPLGGAGGGLCRLKGRRVLFLDYSADLATQIEQCLSALAQVPEVDSVFVLPDLRARIDAYRQA
ncbi:MAG TPA: hypothetical protein VGM03_07095 [Phycisphaerae bacterium]